MKNSKKTAQSLIEYGLILALVAIVALTVLTKLSSSVSKTGDNAANAVNGANDNAMNDYCNSIKAGSKYSPSLGKCDP